MSNIADGMSNSADGNSNDSNKFMQIMKPVNKPNSRVIYLTNKVKTLRSMLEKIMQISLISIDTYNVFQIHNEGWIWECPPKALSWDEI